MIHTKFIFGIKFSYTYPQFFLSYASQTHKSVLLTNIFHTGVTKVRR